MAPRIVGRLTSRRVNTAKPKAGRQALIIGDGGGLWLQITRGEGDHLRRSWTFRYELNGKRREKGLGPLFTIGLAEARAKAKALRQQLLDNIDPLEAREAAKRAKLAEAAKTMTFRQCADAFINLHSAGWGPEHLHQWNASLARYVHPAIGEMAVADIDTAVVMKILEPIWSTKAVTAGRVRSRIEAILDYAAANKFRGNDNPARHVTSALPKKSRLAKTQHFAAVPWEEMPAFTQELRQLQSTAARCLEFLVLTAARTGTAIGAQWSEIDLKAGTWTVPAERMKGRLAHRVPLSTRALELLGNLPRNGPYVFGGTRMLQETALRRQALARLRSAVTVHGCRASFKTWASEATAFAPEIVEVALAHKRGGKVEQSYEKGDLLEKRRRLMQAWADYLGKPALAGAGVVTSIRQKAEA